MKTAFFLILAFVPNALADWSAPSEDTYKCGASTFIVSHPEFGCDIEDECKNSGRTHTYWVFGDGKRTKLRDIFIYDYQPFAGSILTYRKKSVFIGKNGGLFLNKDHSRSCKLIASKTKE